MTLECFLDPNFIENLVSKVRMVNAELGKIIPDNVQKNLCEGMES